MLKTLVNSSLTCSKTVVTAASHIKIKHGQESCKFQFSKYKPPGGKYKCKLYDSLAMLLQVCSNIFAKFEF